MIKAYKYKLKPNSTQETAMNQFLGSARFIYNWGLNRKSEQYKLNGTSPNYNVLAKELTLLKQTEGYTWLQDVPIDALQQSLRNLENAFTRFFREHKGYPKFKSKKDNYCSYKVIKSVHFDFLNWKVKLPKLGWVNICKNRTFNLLNCKQGTVTITKDCCGTYWCSVVVDDMRDKPSKAKMDESTAVGIDLGIKDYAILSDGTKFSNPKYYESSQKKLSKLQKQFAKSEKESHRHELLRIKIAKLYRSMTNQRNDMLHKLSTYIVSSYDNICLEDLNVEGMMKNHHLAKSIHSVGWSTFVNMLNYKSECKGKNVIFIGRFEPSSKSCHNCGYINRDLSLNDRDWVCPVCGEHHDRDINAAINIRHIAFENQNLIGY
jgi:putative transposase